MPQLGVFLSVLLLPFAISHASVDARAQADDALTPGFRRREFVDSTRRSWSADRVRPITTLVWYPTDGVARPETLSIGPPTAPFFRVGVVAPGAPLRAGRRYPLVVMSHGTGGSALQMGWLAHGLARNGFIAAAVNHHGNSGAEPPLDPRGFFLWWERATDLHVAIDRLLADPVIGPHIDRTRIAAVGFSLGGYTVLSLAGAQTDLAMYRAFCASPEHDFTCGPQPEFPQAPALFARMAEMDSATQHSLQRAADSHRDARIRAIVTLAPAVARALTVSSLSRLTIPVLVIAGDSDHVAPPATNARYVVANVPGAISVNVAFADHYVFLDSCTDDGRRLIAEVCVDDARVDRDIVHANAIAAIAGFLRDKLSRP